tara:strand:+ start:16313 stop:16543 length:231 start_codon:yes stop_codon:yes gene_type:complete
MGLGEITFNELLFGNSNDSTHLKGLNKKVAIIPNGSNDEADILFKNLKKEDIDCYVTKNPSSEEYLIELSKLRIFY